MKAEFDTMEEAQAKFQELQAEGKWASSAVRMPDGKIVLQWIEHKKFVAHDGKEFYDEIWTTFEGEMILIQDMEPEHARNALRMILRQDREAQQAMQTIFDKVAEQLITDDTIDNGLDSSNLTPPDSGKNVLH
jgi:hypothetical protein